MKNRKKSMDHSMEQAPPRRCREVICPNCNHRFMWIDGSYGIVLPAYRRRDTGAYLDDTVCPKCGEKLALFPGELVAAFPALDDRIMLNPERGI